MQNQHSIKIYTSEILGQDHRPAAFKFGSNFQKNVSENVHKFYKMKTNKQARLYAISTIFVPTEAEF